MNHKEEVQRFWRYCVYIDRVLCQIDIALNYVSWIPVSSKGCVVAEVNEKDNFEIRVILWTWLGTLNTLFKLKTSLTMEKNNTKAGKTYKSWVTANLKE